MNLLPNDLTEPQIPGSTGGYRNAPVGDPPVAWNAPGLPGAPDGGGLLVVDYAALAGAVSLLQSAASDADGAAGALATAVGAAGPAPWGDDPELGTGFGSAFQQPQQDLLQAVRGVGPVLDRLAAALGGALRQFQGADQDTGRLAGSFTADAPQGAS